MSLDHIRAVFFDAGNTLVHLDYEFIASTLIERGHSVAPREIRRAEYVARRWIDRMFENRHCGTDEQRRFSYFNLILEELGVPEPEASDILKELDEHNRQDCLWRVV